jgi:hypothetical protein
VITRTQPNPRFARRSVGANVDAVRRPHRRAIRRPKGVERGPKPPGLQSVESGHQAVKLLPITWAGKHPPSPSATISQCLFDVSICQNAV